MPLLSFLFSLSTAPLAPSAYWRDLAAFRPTISTIDEPSLLSKALLTLPGHGFTPVSVGRLTTCADTGSTSCHFTFSTSSALGRGYVTVTSDKELDILFTQATSFLSLPPPPPSQPQKTVVIVGAGQCGLSLAARLKKLGCPAVVLEKEPRVGE